MTTTLTDKVEQLAQQDASENQDHERQRFDRYVALLSKGEKATKAEASECYQLMQSLGFATSNMRRHCEVLRDFQRFSDAHHDSIEARREAEALDDEIQRRARIVANFEHAIDDPMAGPVPDAAIQRAEELRRKRGDGDDVNGLDGLDGNQREVIMRDVLSEWKLWADGPRCRRGDLMLQYQQSEKWRAECDALRETHPRLIEAYQRQVSD